MEVKVRIKLLGLVTVIATVLVLVGCPLTEGNSLDYLSSNIGTLKYVPAGTFQRDGTATNTSTVSAFRMSQYEITRAQFLAIMGTDPSYKSCSSGTSDPVQSVNWYQAIAFCNKLSLAEGLTPVYSVKVSGSEVDWSTLAFASIPTGSTNSDWDAATATWTANGYRLPTEMEWKWAAMGATSDRSYGYTGSGTNTTGYQKAFAGSTGNNAIGAYAVFGYYVTETGSTTTNRTNPIGSKLPNELGLYDMSGNVSEWNWDWYGAYPVGALSDYRGGASGPNRILPGGNWSSYASYCTVATRGGNYPYNPGSVFGFRVARP
jgi:formylglycine-generating enzyme